MTPEEREQIRVRFAVSLTNLRHVAIYWSPTGKKIYARSVPHEEWEIFSSSHGRRPLPRDSVRVGFYASPFNSSTFLGDLDELIHRLGRQSA